MSFKNKVIAVLSVLIIILIYLYVNKEKVEINTIETITKYDTITSIVDNTKPTQIEKVYIKVFDTIRENDTITKIIYRDKKVNEYVYNDTVKNGRLKSTILADKIYKRDIEFTSYNKNTETIKTVLKSNLFIGINTAFKFDKTLDNTSINAYYVRKDKYLLNGGLGFQMDSNKPIANIGFAIKF